MAFITTTFIHHLGALNLPTSSSKNNLNQVAFFMLQPVAITVEDFVVYLGEKAGLKESCKLPPTFDIPKD
jgi:type II secretory pathway component PulL